MWSVRSVNLDMKKDISKTTVLPTVKLNKQKKFDGLEMKINGHFVVQPD